MDNKNKYLSKSFVKIYSLIQKNLSLKKMKELMYYIDRILCLFIKKAKYYDNKKKSILIIFNLALGDGVIFLNSIANLRSKYPKSEYQITLVCQKGLDVIYTNNAILDKVISFDFTKATVNIKERFKVIKEIRKNYYDIVLDPVGVNECFTNVLMTKNALGKIKIGCIIDLYEKKCSKNILKKTYNNIKKIYTKTLIEQYYEFFYDSYDVKYSKLPMVNNKLKLPKNYYIVFPSASMNLKKWPIERYAELIKKIYKKTNLPLVICGTKVDQESFDELLPLISNVEIINIIGKTNLLEFIDVIDKASFVISNDTSTYHIGVICQTPTAIITGGYTYDRYVSYEFNGSNKYKKPYIIVNKMPCFNCINNCNKINKNDSVWPCLNNVTVDYAWKIIEKMIEKEM